MQLIHHGGFSEDERKACRNVIYEHVVQSVEDALAVIRKSGLAYAHEVCTSCIYLRHTRVVLNMLVLLSRNL
jgi:glutamate mutase epsilon subunit